MAGINIASELARVSSNIEIVQYEIASQENVMNSLLNSEAGEESMMAVQVYIAQLRASLGALRGHESHLKDELLEDRKSRDNNKLAQG